MPSEQSYPFGIKVIGGSFLHSVRIPKTVTERLGGIEATRNLIKEILKREPGNDQLYEDHYTIDFVPSGDEAEILKGIIEKIRPKASTILIAAERAKTLGGVKAIKSILGQTPFEVVQEEGVVLVKFFADIGKGDELERRLLRAAS